MRAFPVTLLPELLCADPTFYTNSQTRTTVIESPERRSDQMRLHFRSTFPPIDIDRPPISENPDMEKRDPLPLSLIAFTCQAFLEAHPSVGCGAIMALYDTLEEWKGTD
ncbi:hypothetical protein BS17DRAFT_883262 [Gyrodon lividus]|nr:hypothetical protein BS17DRAFT_883262 [Gyrodon lividus]